MGFAVGIAIFVLGAAVAVAVFTLWYLRSPKLQLPAELIERRQAIADALDELAQRVPSRPKLQALDLPNHPSAAKIEAKLLAMNPEAALREAETLLTAEPGDPRTHLLLARALVYNDQVEAADAELKECRELGGDGPMADFLEARIRHLRIMRLTDGKRAASIQDSPVPSLITPFELFVLRLERQRQLSGRAAGLWQPGGEKQSLAPEEIIKLVSQHFGLYYDCLEKLLAALEIEPGFAEALYHSARLALKVGLIRQGARMLEAIEPLMNDSIEAYYYRRDLSQLRDEKLPENLAPPVPRAGRRSPRLRVLS